MVDPEVLFFSGQVFIFFVPKIGKIGNWEEEKNLKRGG